MSLVDKLITEIKIECILKKVRRKLKIAYRKRIKRTWDVCINLRNPVQCQINTILFSSQWAKQFVFFLQLILSFVSGITITTTYRYQAKPQTTW